MNCSRSSRGSAQPAIPRIIDALANADKQETAGFVAVLASLLDNKTFPAIAAGLVDGNQRTVAGITTALANSQRYAPSLLLGLLDRAGHAQGHGHRDHGGTQGATQCA